MHRQFQDVGITSYLQSLWLRAYDGEVFVSDLTGEPSGRLRSMEFFNALQNYRRKVRHYRLHPIYAAEWARIDRVKLSRLSSTCFALVKIDNQKYLEKCERREVERSPLVRFKFPTSITYI